MMHRYNFEALDRCLRDLARNTSSGNLPFGGHVVMFCGDFRQIPTVITRGSRPAIVDASLQRSNSLWRHLRVMVLTINMRVHRLTGELMMDTSDNLSACARIATDNPTCFAGFKIE